MSTERFSEGSVWTYTHPASGEQRQYAIVETTAGNGEYDAIYGMRRIDGGGTGMAWATRNWLIDNTAGWNHDEHEQAAA